MELEKEIVPVVDDESVLDKELEESISAVKAGNALQSKIEVKPEVKPGETPIIPKEESAGAAPDVEPKEEVHQFRIPNKGKFESDEAFEKRTELLDLVQRRKQATTPEAKQALSEKINTTKSQLKTLSGSDKKIIQPNPGEGIVQPEQDEALKADKERLKQLGGATKEDIQEILSQERQTIDTKNTLDRFVERYADLKDDADVREVFFDFVDANYNWQDKTGKELMTVLELAREAMFKPSDSIQERVLKGANVAEKVNAMQFPGGTIAKQSYSPEMQKSIDELKATGMSEEKALELLSE